MATDSGMPSSRAPARGQGLLPVASVPGYLDVTPASSDRYTEPFRKFVVDRQHGEMGVTEVGNVAMEARVGAGD